MRNEYPFIFKVSGRWYVRGGGVLPRHPSEGAEALAAYEEAIRRTVKTHDPWGEAAALLDGPTPYLDYFSWLTDQQIQNFGKKIIRKRGADACWPWRGKSDPNGYGLRFMRTIGRAARAHRVAIAYFKFVEPGDHFVCHHCDNPICCRPDHLYLGDAQSNADDRVKRNRVNPAIGPRAPSAKLTQNQAECLREMFRDGARPVDLAEKFGISRSAAWQIAHNNTYRTP